MGLAWAKLLRPLVLGVVGLLALLLIAILFTPPRTSIEIPAPAPTVATSPAPRPDGLTADQSATLASLQRVDDYPLYTMRYIGSTLSGGPQPGVEGAVIAQDASFDSAGGCPAPLRMLARFHAFACSLFAALGDPANRLSAATLTGATAPRCCSSPTGPPRAVTRRSRWWISRISASAMERLT